MCLLIFGRQILTSRVRILRILVFDWQDGLRTVLDANRTLGHRAKNTRLTMGEMSIEGETGTLDLNGFGEITLLRKGSLEPEKIDCAFDDTDFGGDCVYHLHQHVIAHLRGKGELETGARDYLRNMRIEELCYRSAHESRKLPIE